MSKSKKKKLTESVLESPENIKFPMKQFFSARSETEEEIIIERYSMQLNSQRKEDEVSKTGSKMQS